MNETKQFYPIVLDTAVFSEEASNSCLYSDKGSENNSLDSLNNRTHDCEWEKGALTSENKGLQ